MKQIKVMGTGCANCENTYRLIEQCAESMNIEVALSKVEELTEIMKYGILSTPGVVIDDQVVHSGGIPDRQAVCDWLSQSDAVQSSCCEPGSGCC